MTASSHRKDFEAPRKQNTESGQVIFLKTWPENSILTRKMARDIVGAQREVPVQLPIVKKLILQIEQNRLEKEFQTSAQYYNWPGIREKQEHKPFKILRNFYRNAIFKRFSPLYPLEKLFRWLPMLLDQALNPGEYWKSCSINSCRPGKI